MPERFKESLGHVAIRATLLSIGPMTSSHIFAKTQRKKNQEIILNLKKKLIMIILVFVTLKIL